MLKVLAVLRTVFLVFIVAFTIRSMPWSVEVARTFDEQYARSTMAVASLQRAAWYAVSWIAFETLVGWWVALRASRLAREGRDRDARAATPPAPGA